MVELADKKVRPLQEYLGTFTVMGEKDGSSSVTIILNSRKYRLEEHAYQNGKRRIITAKDGVTDSDKELFKVILDDTSATVIKGDTKTEFVRQNSNSIWELKK